MFNENRASKKTKVPLDVVKTFKDNMIEYAKHLDALNFCSEDNDYDTYYFGGEYYSQVKEWPDVIGKGFTVEESKKHAAENFFFYMRFKQ